jgi:phosphoglycerate kinase
VETLTRVRENPGKPLVVIIGGAKVEDKLQVVISMAKIADTVLVGGKIAKELIMGDLESKNKIVVAKLNEDSLDIAQETVNEWVPIISSAKMIVWNGPLGKIEEEGNDQSRKIAQMIIESGAESIIGGGDTITYLDKLGYLERFSFVSTGGGAMLKFLETGTLPTIEALK